MHDMHIVIHAVKILHLICVVLTFISFLVRGYWMMIDSSCLDMRIVKIAPHFIDTILFASGLVMAITLYGEFYHVKWLMIKLSVLLGYIILGSIALKHGRTKLIKLIAYTSALCLFSFIAVLGRYHALLPFTG